MRRGPLALVLAVTALGCGTAVSQDDAGELDAALEDVGRDATSGCRHASDCGAQVCIGGECVAETRCMSSRACPGLVCDTVSARCVECVTSGDCAAAERCRAGVCELANMCNGDRDCTAMGEVCDPSTMACAECNANVDCPSGLRCASDHACVPPVCVPGSTTCVTGFVATCAADGSGYGTAVACPSGTCMGGACVEGLDAAVDAGPHDAGVPDANVDAFAPDAFSPDAGSDASRANGMWETMGAGGSLLMQLGYSDASPLGDQTFYAVSSTPPSFARFNPSSGWSGLSPPPAAGVSGANLAFIGNSLYFVNAASSLHRYDIGGGGWVFRTTLDPTTSSLTHDDAGHLYFLTSDDRIGEHDVGTNTTRYLAFGMDMPVTRPLLAWDPVTRRLYVSPNANTSPSTTLYAVNLGTGEITLVRPFPGDRMGSTFCADRNGSLYAGAVTPGNVLMRYDLVMDRWDSLPALPFPQRGGPCTVADGFLYYTDDGSNLARYRLW